LDYRNQNSIISGNVSVVPVLIVDQDVWPPALIAVTIISGLGGIRYAGSLQVGYAGIMVQSKSTMLIVDHYVSESSQMFNEFIMLRIGFTVVTYV
jgi:hypothetical protein